MSPNTPCLLTEATGSLFTGEGAKGTEDGAAHGRHLGHRLEPRLRRHVPEREGTPYVELHKQGDRIVGEYHIGLQNGTLDGHPQPDGSLLFSFEGMDELEEVNGAGTATLHDDRLVLTLMYHQGDDYIFEATRRS